MMRQIIVYLEVEALLGSLQCTAFVEKAPA